MAYHASLSQISLLYSHVMTHIPNVTTLDNTSMSPYDHDKPKWLVAIDYATIISLITVLSLSTCLLITTALNSWRGGAVRLDHHDGTEKKAITRKDRLSDTLLQNMDHTLFDDGEAVDIAGFWRKVRWHKSVNTLCIVGLASFQCYRLSISPGISNLNRFGRLQLSVEATTAFYPPLLLPCYLHTRRDKLHSQITYHMFALSSISTIHYYFATLGQYLAIDYLSRPHWTAYYCLGLACMSTISTGTISTGPGRFRDLSRLYNKAVADKAAEGEHKVEANVLGSDRSIIGNFMGTHVTEMVRQVAQLDQVDLHELPVMPAHMQQQPSILESVSWKKQNAIRPTSASSLLWEVWGPQWLGWVKSTLCLTLEIIFGFIPHFCIQQILYILDDEGHRQSAWAYASLWTLSNMGESICMVLRTWDFSFLNVDRRMRSHLSFLLYRKLLIRSTYAVPTGPDQAALHSNAELMNLIQSDVPKLKDLLWTLTRAGRIILKMAIGFLYIWTILGPSGLLGVTLSLLIYPPAYLLSQWQYRIFKAFVAVGDKRVSILQEALQTISMIKMTASEAFWYKRMDSVRQEEFRLQLKSRLVSTASGLLYAFAPVLVIAVAFGHFTIIRGETLTPSIAFTAISVFGEFRHSMTSVPQLLTDALQEILSVQRITTFLQKDDVEYLDKAETISSPADDEEPLTVVGDIAWSKPQERADMPDINPFVLRDLDLAFPRAKMTIIAGKFGSGKSLLLMAMLGEVALLKGRIAYAVSSVADPWETETAFDWSHSTHGLAYVPQVPWLQSLSIRDNILFGLPLNVERYRQVIYACALLPDLELLEDGDLTEIGERGKILSGGQKARVSLARAVYSRASTILLDDVISAVDAHTSQHIIHKCFKSSLMAGRTIIIATHAVESLAPLADRAIYLDDGRVQWQGTGLELLETEYMSHLKSEAAFTRPLDVQADVVTAAPDPSSMPRKTSLASQSGPESFEVVRLPAKTPRQLLVDEDRAKGSVAFGLWTDLLKMNGGPLYFVAFVSFTLISIIGPVAERQYLKTWTGGSSAATPLAWVVGYTCLSAALMVIQNVQYFLSFYGGFAAMKKIYAITQDRVLRANMRFFTKTRAGSILQRLGPDLAQVPECSQLLGSIIESAFGLLISVFSVAYYIGWSFPLGVAVMVAISYQSAMWYRISSRQVRRLMSILPGPVNALYRETVAGAAVIRAFGMQSVFVQNLIKTTNMHQSSYVLALSIGRWMAGMLTDRTSPTQLADDSEGWLMTVRVDLLDVIIVSATLGLVIRAPDMTGAQAGFIIGFAQRIVSELHNLLHEFRNYDLDGVKLERLAEYRLLETENIPCLYDAEGSGSGTPASVMSWQNWPSEGAVQVSDLCARYAPDMPDILHDVSFSCRGGDRIGIVGATGGGKSTLAKALFSFVEVTAGKIEIDDQDIAGIPLSVLRSRMGIIAQDPVLLSGALRLNLDIEGKYPDEELLQVLREVQLIHANEGISEPSSETSSVTAVGDGETAPGKTPSNANSSNVNVFLNLDFEIETGGQNLSPGQKQLVVMARALLSKHKLLILDEATASIDSATDAEISKVVHEQFEGVTVLIIAHRLQTIMPCTKILVMDQGRIVQQGSPYELINEEGGMFERLCKAAGEIEFQHLRSIADQGFSTSSNL